MSDKKGILTIDFKSFADALKITEGELAYLLENDQGWNRKRKFNFKDVSNFLELLNKTK
ncbi:hypothetical protein ACNDUI_004578 [Escherichia coli]